MGTIIEKVKEKGIKGICRSVYSRVSDPVNCFMFYVFKLFPLRENQIVLESEGDCSDNAYALYDYMCKNGYLGKYKVIWLVEDKKKFKGDANTVYEWKQWGRLAVKSVYYLATSKYFLYDHVCLLATYTKRPEQRVIYLGHGAGYKANKGKGRYMPKTSFEETYTPGRIPNALNTEYFKCPAEMVKDLGYPRLDYFFEENEQIKGKLEEYLKLDQYDKVLLWMPTFRKCDLNENISEDYIENETGLPLLGTLQLLSFFDQLLKDKNMLLILKIHHLQASLPIFKQKYENIKFLKDEDLLSRGVQLYQFIKYTDALITDYSSISPDYMLLNRPIIFTLDDYEEFNKSRGIYPENALELMRGYHVFTAEELMESVKEIHEGIDKYKESREELLPEFHTHQDGLAAKRILDHLNIVV